MYLTDSMRCFDPKEAVARVEKLLGHCGTNKVKFGATRALNWQQLHSRAQRQVIALTHDRCFFLFLFEGKRAFNTVSERAQMKVRCRGNRRPTPEPSACCCVEACSLDRGTQRWPSNKTKEKKNNLRACFSTYSINAGSVSLLYSLSVSATRSAFVAATVTPHCTR